MRTLLIAFAAIAASSSIAAAEGGVSNILFINRCKGGCAIRGGVNDARANTSSLPCNGQVVQGNGGSMCNGTSAGDYTITEYENAAKQTGAAADAEWNAVMQCLREVYSPYNVKVVDERPADGANFTMGIVAGLPQEIGYPQGSVLGLGGASGCAPEDNTISMTFANLHTHGPGRVIQICWTASQETAHSFGLRDHEYEFIDGSSACPDPMTYRSECGNTQRFFRNQQARCGESSVRTCLCAGTQNSHARLLQTFGPGTPLTAPPALALDSPANNETIKNGATVLATASSQRGIARMELWLNNYKWLTVKGAPFGSNGQPSTQYMLQLPAAVPDSVIDLEVKAFDDIDAETDAKVTVTKGAPCMTADTCAKGQKCEQGRCFWDPPAGQTGDACTYPQFCVSGNCLEASDGQYCTNTCVVGVTDSCPTGFDCLGETGQSGVCVHATDGGGCCSIGNDGRSAALLSLVVGLMIGRRRRR